MSRPKARDNVGSAAKISEQRSSIKTRCRRYVGIDVGKFRLEVASGRTRFDVANSEDGHAQILKRFRLSTHRYHFICENTGRYERKLVEFLQARGCLVSVLPSHVARSFAQTIGLKAKTDRLDSLMLAKAGEMLNPKPYRRRSSITERLLAAVRRKAQIGNLLRTQLSQRHELTDDFRREADKLIEFLNNQRNDLDLAFDRTISKSSKLLLIRAALCEVEGVAKSTANIIIAEIPELGRLNRKEVAAIAGLAPFNKDSGGTTGARRIRGGRWHVRLALYMAAFSAVHCNRILRPFYRRLRKRGKPFRVALVAVMRKLLIHLNTVARRALEESSRRRSGEITPQQYRLARMLLEKHPA